ncbi:hypothetical protein N9H30_00750 [bacterium]|nr:hypothetical protein [bacterium]|tara:strand:- start:217 stop:579 length:363 start_codon:yes stop_codon:yes gene_type:complete
MIKDRNTTVLASDYQSTEQLKKFLVHCTGAKLIPVANNTDAFWIRGDSRGDFYEQKYFKVVFGNVTEEFRHGKPTKSGYGFDIQATGDYRAWALMGDFRKMISEAMANYKAKTTPENVAK